MRCLCSVVPGERCLGAHNWELEESGQKMRVIRETRQAGAPKHRKRTSTETDTQSNGAQLFPAVSGS